MSQLSRMKVLCGLNGILSCLLNWTTLSCFYLQELFWKQYGKKKRLQIFWDAVCRYGVGLVIGSPRPNASYGWGGYMRSRDVRSSDVARHSTSSSFRLGPREMLWRPCGHRGFMANIIPASTSTPLSDSQALVPVVSSPCVSPSLASVTIGLNVELGDGACSLSVRWQGESLWNSSTVTFLWPIVIRGESRIYSHRLRRMFQPRWPQSRRFEHRQSLPHHWPIVIRDGIRAYRHRLRRAFQPRRPQSRHRQSPYQHACGWGYMRSRGIRSVIVSSWAEGDVMTSLWSQWVNGEHSPRVYLDSRKWFASTGSCDVIFVRLAKPGVHDYRTECGTWWRCLQFVSTVAGQEPAKRLHSHIFITHRHQRGSMMGQRLSMLESTWLRPSRLEHSTESVTIDAALTSDDDGL